jgi:hypothetical protein
MVILVNIFILCVHILVILLMLSAIETKWLLKVSAMCCWLLINIPSMLRDSVVVLLAFLCVSEFTVFQVVLNYRPISLLSVFSKNLEKFMYTRWIALITENNILTEVQNGFREVKSTETAIHDFLENIQEAIDEKINLTGIFLHLSKAYDVLNHKILLYKLDGYGIRGVVNLWFKSYLSNLKQCVKINYVESTKQMSGRYTSDFKEIKHGVPQASVLGPVLFLLYIIFQLTYKGQRQSCLLMIQIPK